MQIISHPINATFLEWQCSAGGGELVCVFWVYSKFIPVYAEALKIGQHSERTIPRQLRPVTPHTNSLNAASPDWLLPPVPSCCLSAETGQCFAGHHPSPDRWTDRQWAGKLVSGKCRQQDWSSKQAMEAGWSKQSSLLATLFLSTACVLAVVVPVHVAHHYVECELCAGLSTAAQLAVYELVFWPR